jgi:hypothetical protein
MQITFQIPTNYSYKREPEISSQKDVLPAVGFHFHLMVHTHQGLDISSVPNPPRQLIALQLLPQDFVQ